jgi:hypothetical protein
VNESDTHTVYRSLGEKRYVEREVEILRKTKGIEMRGSAQLPSFGGRRDIYCIRREEITI